MQAALFYHNTLITRIFYGFFGFVVHSDCPLALPLSMQFAWVAITLAALTTTSWGANRRPELLMPGTLERLGLP